MSACIPGGVPLGKPGKQRAATRRACKVSRRDTGRPERTSHDDAAGEGRRGGNATVANDRVRASCGPAVPRTQHNRALSASSPGRRVAARGTLLGNCRRLSPLPFYLSRGTVGHAVLAAWVPRALRCALVACVLACHRPAPSTAGEVVLSSVDFQDDGHHVLLELRITNGRASPVYVYAQPMQLQYDTARRTLNVVMHVAPSPPTGTSDVDCTVAQPSIRTIAAGTGDRLEVRLGRVEHVLPSGPSATTWPIYQAARVDVELGWSTQPLQLANTSGKCREQADRELQALEDGIARGHWSAD
jgi:hypothetical protein